MQRKRKYDLREILDTIFWILLTGNQSGGAAWNIPKLEADPLLFQQIEKGQHPGGAEHAPEHGRAGNKRATQFGTH